MMLGSGKEGALAAVILLLCLVRSCVPSGASVDGNAINLAQRGMEVADEARRSERDTILAMDRLGLMVIALVVAVPLVTAFLIFRECGRKEPKVEEVVAEVSKAMLEAEKRARLPEATSKELEAPER